MSKVAGFIIGGLEVIAGIVLVATGVGGPLGVELIIQGSLMIATQAIVDLTMPKTPARDAQEMTLQLGEQPRCALFGECFTAGSMVDAFDFGGQYGTNWEVLIIRLADHKCHSLTGFYVNDELITYAGNGNVPEFNGEHYEMLHIHFRADTSTEVFPSEVTDNWPGYSAANKGGSGCDVAIMYRCDTPKGKNPIWPGGRPHFGFVGKWALCYDPRLDDTVAGSGPHRWDDPSTREWSENAAICRYNWVRGIYANDQVTDSTQLLIGRGLSAEEAPPENIFAAANLCDEVVNDKPRYRVAGPVYSNQPSINVEQMFADATGGSIITHDGDVQLEPGAAKSVVATITDSELLSGGKASWNGGVLSDSDGAWINSATANYVEPSQHWAEHDAPVVREDADIIVDGGPKEATLSLRLVKDVDQAQRVADIARRLGRKWGRATVTLGPRYCYLEAGDWIIWQSDRRFAGGSRTFRIEACSIDEKWQVTLTLREISADCFDGSTFQPDYSVPVSVTPPPPSVSTPGATAWTLTPVILTDSGASVPALELTGDAFADDDQVEEVIVEYWKSDGVIDPIANPDDPPWSMEGTHDPSVTKIDITPGVAGDYYVAVTYIVDGDRGDRLVLGPATLAGLDVSPQIDAAASADVTASEAIAAASFVNVYSASGAKVRKANATDGTKPVNGFAPAAIANGVAGSVRGAGGKIGGLAGLTPGETYFLDTTGGAIVDTPPAGAGNLVQEIGVAVSATELLFNPRQGVTL